MIKLNKKEEYALLALSRLAQAPYDFLLSAKEISEHLDVPFDVLSRVLQILVQNKILESVQGIYGGYRLVKPLEEITFYNFLLIINGSFRLVPCLEPSSSAAKDCQKQRSCLIEKSMANLQIKMVEFFKSFTLKEVIADQVNFKKTRENSLAHNQKETQQYV